LSDDVFDLDGDSGGYLFAFLQDVPLTPAAYFSQIGDALRWQDFILLSLKTLMFGAIIAVVSCYHGLAHPLRVGMYRV